MRHTEAMGEWDGVDMATAPCLQRHVAASRSNTWQKNSPYAADRVSVGEGFAKTALSDQDGKNVGRGQNLVAIQPRSTTPPALLIYKPCLRCVLLLAIRPIEALSSTDSRRQDDFVKIRG